MADVTAGMVKELRDRTSAGMMDCKKALAETQGDMEAAIDWLRAKGLSAAAKKAGRTASEGLVGVVVEGITLAKRHTKPRQGSTSGVGGVPKIEPGGILDVNHPVPIGKVMLVCSSCGKPTRIGHRTLDNGRRVRVCKNCGEQLEVKS